METGRARVVRPLDWVDPEHSKSLLVFDRRFARERPEAVRSVVEAIMERTSKEHGMPSERRRERSPFKGPEIETRFLGSMTFPVFRRIPRVDVGQIRRWQELLRRHGEIDGLAAIEDYVDNGFVDAVSAGGAPEAGR